MQKPSNKSMILKALATAGLACAFLLNTNTLSANNDFRALAEHIMAQSQDQDSRKDQKNRRKTELQNNLIDRSRSRTRSDTPERAEIRVSLDQAVNMIRRSSSGRVIKATTTYSGGRPVHNIRVLSENNRVRTYRIDAISGRRL